jgi:hypothetical protein
MPTQVLGAVNPVKPLPERRQSTQDQRDAWAAQREVEERLSWLEAKVLLLLERQKWDF